MASVAAKSFLDQFHRKVPLMALTLPAAIIERTVKPLKEHWFVRRNVRPVFPDPADPARRLVLLRESITADSVPPAVARVVQEHPDVRLITMDVQLDPSNFTLDELLRGAITDPAVEIPSAYEAVGHIAHVNLHPEQLPYKHCIGEAMLLAVPNTRTVVNKLATVHAQYRTFDMELLAGEECYDVEVSESNCRFRFNYRDVYWNSRLQEEHRRIVATCEPPAVVCDMFAGIGPFAIPAAKKGCRVLANDLNPASYGALVANAVLNKVTVTAFNMDARAFVRHLCEPEADGAPRTRFPFDVVVMNLPKDAVEFLDVFVGCLPALEPGRDGPTIHCYAFCNPDQDDLQTRVWDALDVTEHDDERPQLSVRKVRDISPKKFMYCVRFVLPHAVAVRAPRKRRKIRDAEEANEDD